MELSLCVEQTEDSVLLSHPLYKSITNLMIHSPREKRIDTQLPKNLKEQGWFLPVLRHLKCSFV